MPRSSRHKSSKHSSRDARGYSDSEDESGSRERRDEGEDGKRRVESKDIKDVYGSGNGDYAEDYGYSKRRKEKFSDGVSDRWNGGDGEGSNRAKSSSESKSRRRDEGNEDARRSGKIERHKESSRKEGRESGRSEREGKAEKIDEQQEIATDSRSAAASESENISDRRARKRREGLDDGGKYQYDVGDTKSRHAYSEDDAGRGGRQKDEKLRDERHRDKYREAMDKDSKRRYDKQKDDYPAKDRSASRSSEKYLRDEKDIAETRPKKSKPHDIERGIDPSHEHDRYRDRHMDRDRDDLDRDRDHEHDPDWDYNHDGDRNRERDREWVKERERDRPSIHDKERDRDWERGKEKDHDQEWERDHDYERDYDDRSIRYKDHRGKKRSPEDRDDYYDSKLRDTKARSSNMEKRSLSGTRAEVDDRGSSQPCEGHLDNVMGSSRSQTSPTSRSHGGIDEYRHEKDDDPKYRDSSKGSRLRAISPKESAGFSGPADIASKHTSFDKYNKLEDGHFGGFSAERSSISKASPRGLTERSPSSMSLERNRNTSRAGTRWNLDSDELRRRSGSSTDGRDFPVTEGRLSREMSMGKHSVDEPSQADSSFNSKPGPGNSSSLISPQPPRRNNDPNLGRGHGNNWRAYPNWPSPVPSGFAPFQHGPPHGNFPAMMPHFPSPPLFGVRPPMEINQSGLPYHLGDTDRFPGHLRPIGWQNMMDASGLPRFHGWERSGGLLREEPHLYQGPDWDQNRQLMNIRGWETNSDPWKGQNGDLSVELPSVPKEEHPVQVPEDEGDPKDHGPANGKSQQPKVQAKDTGGRQEVLSLEREVGKSGPLKADDDLGPASSNSTEVDALAQLSCAYLSKLDISVELADPELYEQCLSLMGGEETSTGDGNSVLHVVMEGHGNAMQDGSSRGLQLPAIDDSLFKKVMDHYKKQRLEPWSSVPFSILSPLDTDSLANGDRVGEHHCALSEDKKGKMMEDMGEKMPDLSLLSSDEMNMMTHAASSAEQKHDCLVIPSDGEAAHSANVPSQNETEGSADGIIQSVGDNGARAASGNTRVSSPLVNDGSCGEALESLKSNESKVENIGRIHQSPESTH